MSAVTQFTNPPPSINLPNLSVPPPVAHNLSAPPPALTMIETSTNFQPRYSNYRDNNRGFFKPFRPYHAPKLISGNQEVLQDEFDGKRLRKSVMRKTVDYNSAIIKSLENRIWQRDYRDRRALQPDVIYYPDLLPPPSYIDNPMNAVTTRFVKTATNKMRCPIFCMAWTPEGRRLVTGASSGEFTLWNGLTFNFETILQAHDSPVRTMVWSHNESWMVTGDHAGYVKYWQSNMNNVKMFQAHKEAIRGLSFSPTDHKLVTCSDDGTVRIWDFSRCHEERILRGHGADVKCVHWHPQKSLVISGSKDNQQPVKLWDPKSGHSLATLHAHKSTVMDVKWNENGNWLITASRDHLLKLFDLRNLNQEVQTFRGHKKEASSVAWHPNHEGLFCSGGSDGSILFWHVGADKEVGAIEQAHDSIVWTLAWHPLGHILCSGSNDHTSKFWTRNRPGDLMRDKYNLNTLPAGAGGIDDHEIADEAAVIPGMGPEDRINAESDVEDKNGEIPGLDLENSIEDNKKLAGKKVPYSKPIPRNFQAQWNEMEAEDTEQVDALNAIVNQLIETTPGAVPLNDVTPNAIILYGKMIPVKTGSKLAEAISQGTDAINKLVQSGEIEELREIVRTNAEQEETEDYLQDDGEIDFSKVPDVELPTPLASSKFAQNPELLKVLNRGGKHKLNQLLGWNDGGANERKFKIYQPVLSGVQVEDSHDQGIDSKCHYATEKIVSKKNSTDAHDESLSKSIFESPKNMSIDNHLKYNISRYRENSGDPCGGKDLRSDSRDSETRQVKNSFHNIHVTTSDKDSNITSYWNKELNTLKKSDVNVSHEIIMKCEAKHVDYTGSETQLTSKSQNNPDFSPSNNPSILNVSHNSSKINLHSRIDGNPSHVAQQHNMNPTFRPIGPPPQLTNNFNSHFRNPSNNNFVPNVHFRPVGPFPNQIPFNNFPGPPPNYRVPNPNFDRGTFGGSNFRGQSSIQLSGSMPNNYNNNFGNFPAKNGPNRGSSTNRIANENNRTNFNGRGRGRDHDQSRGIRGRDNY